MRNPFYGTLGNPVLVPTVDALDLESLWQVVQRVHERAEDDERAEDVQQGLIAIAGIKQVCQPGADMGAVWVRLSMVERLMPVLALSDDATCANVFSLPLDSRYPGRIGNMFRRSMLKSLSAKYAHVDRNVGNFTRSRPRAYGGSPRRTERMWE